LTCTHFLRQVRARSRAAFAVTPTDADGWTDAAHLAGQATLPSTWTTSRVAARCRRISGHCPVSAAPSPIVTAAAELTKRRRADGATAITAAKVITRIIEVFVIATLRVCPSGPDATTCAAATDLVRPADHPDAAAVAAVPGHAGLACRADVEAVPAVAGVGIGVHAEPVTAGGSGGAGMAAGPAVLGVGQGVHAGRDAVCGAAGLPRITACVITQCLAGRTFAAEAALYLSILEWALTPPINRCIEDIRVGETHVLVYSAWINLRACCFHAGLQCGVASLPAVSARAIACVVIITTRGEAYFLITLGYIYWRFFTIPGRKKTVRIGTAPIDSGCRSLFDVLA
jgi:hypothetical protein